jgi:DNA repair protein SbcC/Rad50
MRPLRLDITGFAAFRDATTVDFASADYFALTGPTGSGKSTVIDAMTFALYGSAPRWGRENAIQYALAPTANRCAVRLVFDVAGQRYVAAREVRRSGKSITQRNPRLERYLDPAASGDPESDEPTESLAADPRAVRHQVAELLGLDFEDFCTCVVLPQGDFATFLQASVGERQNILLKLLGARHYESIGRMAGKRATEASARIDALQGQLTSYDDATADAEQAARAREVTLGALLDTVATETDALVALVRRRTEVAQRADRLLADVAALDAVATPDGVAELHRVLAAADESYRLTRTAAREADEALAVAEEALTAGPLPGPLQETLRWHEERAQLLVRAPVLAAASETTGGALIAAR